MSEDNKAYVYPELTGRRRIYSDVDKITRDNIFEVLEKAMVIHMKNANEMTLLMRYEKGIQPLVREKIIRKEVNIKVSDNLANQITEFKLGYVWGQPITYVQRGNKDLRSSTDSQNEIQDDGISMLNELNDSEYAFSKDQELGRYVEINGIGYQFVDIKKNYNGLAPFDLVTLNPLFTFCIYRNSALQEKLAGVTFRRTENGDVYYTVFTPDTRYEIKNMQTVINGTVDKNEWSFMKRNGEKNPFKKIPIVEFNRSTDRTGCFERQISDMNALNVEVSDFANSVAQTTQEVYFGVGFELPPGEDGKVQAPVGGQWILARNTGNGGTPTLKAISSTFDYQGVQENIVSKRNTILQKAYVPVQTDPGGGSTGSAMNMSSGWSAAENSACKEEQILRRGKAEIVELEMIAIKSTNDIPFDSPLRSLEFSDIKPKFIRNKTYDLATKVNSMVAMINSGVNGRVAMEQVDLFPDVAQAWADSKKTIEEYQKSLIHKSEPQTGEKKVMPDLSDLEERVKAGVEVRVLYDDMVIMMFTNLSFDELNALVTNERSLPYETYFGEMTLTEEEKSERIKMSEDLEEVFITTMIWLFTLEQASQ